MDIWLYLINSFWEKNNFLEHMADYSMCYIEKKTSVISSTFSCSIQYIEQAYEYGHSIFAPCIKLQTEI